MQVQIREGRGNSNYRVDKRDERRMERYDENEDGREWVGSVMPED